MVLVASGWLQAATSVLDWRLGLGLGQGAGLGTSGGSGTLTAFHCQGTIPGVLPKKSARLSRIWMAVLVPLPALAHG